VSTKGRQHRRVFLMLGNQLFPVARLRNWQGALFFLAEDYATCRNVRHHKHKLLFTLSAMRAHAELLRREGFSVEYVPLSEESNRLTYVEKLRRLLSTTGFKELVHFEIEDPLMERRIARFADRHGIQRTVVPTPMFLCSREDFADWLDRQQTPALAAFYQWQRTREDILMEPDGRPRGGRWSFEGGGRKPIPPTVPIPDLPSVRQGRHVRDLQPLITELFAEHPGSVDDFWLPNTRAQATDWLKDFLEQRFSCFGDYGDAIAQRSDALFHSALSPLLNTGLLTPREVVSRTLSFAEDERVALSSVEPFLRQVIGAREFVRGMYRHYGTTMSRRNFWGHQRGLTSDWYTGNTGIEPLDYVIRKAERLGWAHHNERLMIAGNLMLLCEIEPRQAYRWFMEMFVDSAHWVMNPNVYGLALFSDGGLFSSKPHISGANYLMRLGDFERGDWMDTLDGLFLRFVSRNSGWFNRQPRLAGLVENLERMPAERQRRLSRRAEAFLRDKTIPVQEVA